MEGNIAKPLVIARHDFINELTDVINRCNLPAFIIEAVLKDLYRDVKDVANKQLSIELQHYKAAQAQTLKHNVRSEENQEVSDLKDNKVETHN